MSFTSGLSHASAALASLVITAYLDELFDHLNVAEMTTGAVTQGIKPITGYVGIPTAGVSLLTVTLLSFLWGVAYHRRRFQ